jgi:hypothetical protein
MTNGPTLPPQAYTREILTSAFNWLQTQPESVKKTATSPDTLVGLFRRAQRYGNSSVENDAPISSQNFMTDLKSLAEGLKEFEEPKERPPERQSERPPERRAAVMPPPMTERPIQNHSETRSSQNFAGFQAATQSASQTNSTPYSVSTFAGDSGSAVSPTMNSRSLQMIQEVKNTLNLSSDAEALNMMVAVAYKNLKNLLA